MSRLGVMHLLMLYGVILRVFFEISLAALSVCQVNFSRVPSGQGAQDGDLTSYALFALK